MAFLFWGCSLLFKTMKHMKQPFGLHEEGNKTRGMTAAPWHRRMGKGSAVPITIGNKAPYRKGVPGCR
ncbi:hypothetical protein DSLASN_03770 [Desulfoluna limicola]|uniref:Uncharacterized protein n=1 Tax=Desulfoluna limicola TaxID=2810562 RepID=A0ABM7PC30_9BACT|nr:hypothetical protein DSLASN_03770 [Desulfoluna limicola]